MREFECVPSKPGRFEPFVMSVPSAHGHDRAARRAWWTAFHLLGAQGIDFDEFEVYEFDDEVRGRAVNRSGFVQLTLVTSGDS